MKRELKAELVASLEHMHRDILAILVTSRLDAAAKNRLSAIGESIVDVMKDLQSASYSGKDPVARTYLLFQMLFEFF